METLTKSKPKTQVQLIQAALQNGDALTGLDMLQRFNCFNYKGRINDLRRLGVPIRTEMVKTASGKRIAKYSLIKEKQA